MKGIDYVNCMNKMLHCGAAHVHVHLHMYVLFEHMA